MTVGLIISTIFIKLIPSDPLSIPLSQCRVSSATSVHFLNNERTPELMIEIIEKVTKETRKKRKSNNRPSVVLGETEVNFEIRDTKLDQSKNTKKGIKLQCDLCEKVYFNKNKLASHIKQHAYKCMTCAKTFALKRDLKLHMEEIHGPQMHECSVCEYKSNKKWTLRDHFVRKHTDNYQFSCKFCSKLFKIQNNLKQHINQMHSGNPPIVCEVCGHESKNLHALKSHIKYIHEKPEHVCKICKRRLVSQKGLEQHLHWHETKERVVCEQCGKMFHIPYDLEVHMRSHTGIKPYSCTVCAQSFARRNTLRQHLLIHTGKRPYVCDICGKTFTQKPGLTSHRKSHPGSHPPLPRVYIDSILQGLSRDTKDHPKEVQD
ncbi:zinc finger protein OZF-like [Neodiprion virginianus]|uniref:zinc finger protein OZF-like n=1 Tax=Neodiprion virginianus TaxID=2961670 RepID=UPI001EE71392|nr:zinc finger protein OZF-like [Neodiprion virginianus]